MRKLALLLMVAACGDDGVRHTPDAAPHDGPVTPDGPIDAAGTPVAITVTQNGAGVAGAHVYFQNADSTVVLATTTDATGTASAVMADGGYVTAVDPFPQATFIGGSHEIETFAGVKAGDHLQLTIPPTRPPITVTIQAPLDAAASSYAVFSPCNSDPTSLSPPAPPPLSLIASGPSGAVTLYDCGTTTDFLVVSYDQTGQPLNFYYRANVGVADAQLVDLSAGTYLAAPTRTFTFQNVPGLRSVSFEDDLIDPHGRIFRSYNTTTSDTVTPVVTVPMPEFGGTADLVQSTFTGNYDQQTVLEWGPYTSSYTLDIAAHALPTFSSVPAYDVASHTASITEDATGMTPDFTMVTFDVLREADDSTTWAWRIVAPHSVTVTLPVLPTDLYDYNIAAGDAARVLGWTSGKVAGGYDGIRDTVFTLVDFAALATSSSGTATIASWNEPAPLQRTRTPNAFQSTMVHHASTVAPRRTGRRVQ